RAPPPRVTHPPPDHPPTRPVGGGPPGPRPGRPSRGRRLPAAPRPGRAVHQQPQATDRTADRSRTHDRTRALDRTGAPGRTGAFDRTRTATPAPARTTGRRRTTARGTTVAPGRRTGPPRLVERTGTAEVPVQLRDQHGLEPVQRASGGGVHHDRGPVRLGRQGGHERRTLRNGVSRPDQQRRPGPLHDDLCVHHVLAFHRASPLRTCHATPKVHRRLALRETNAPTPPPQPAVQPRHPGGMTPGSPSSTAADSHPCSLPDPGRGVRVFRTRSDVFARTRRSNPARPCIGTNTRGPILIGTMKPFGNSVEQKVINAPT